MPRADTVVQPVTLDRAHALLAGADSYTERFGNAVADGYLEFPEALPATVQALTDGMDPDWFSHLIIEASTGTVIGFGGFTGPPEDGVVEIGYSIAPAHRGRGHATAAAARWLELAARRGVVTVRAHTLAEDNPSTRVLRRLGFTRTAELIDPQEGPIWRWERSADASARPDRPT
jgi:RimJ/RimL family protein N-acetyltransferase